jgi:oxygen-independent coproporphyrinogen-3 oxidase
LFYINIIPKSQNFTKLQKKASQSENRRDLGLYIHIPFCRTICAYCAFCAFANKADRKKAYLEALRVEIESKSKEFSNYSVSSIYLGGGTPSILETEELTTLLCTVRKNFQLSPAPSLEIEANPESLDLNKLKTYHTLGINRLSLGVQSLNDQTLWKIARPHRAGDTYQALQLIKNFGWKNFGCDLIIGLPYQTRASFLDDLNAVLQFNPVHISTYFLSYDTPRIDSFIQDCPGEEEQIDTYLEAENLLRQHGFDHYEVSNYSRPGHQSGHNLKYWQQDQYLGLGLSAHSYFNKILFSNTSDFEEYLRKPSHAGRKELELDRDLLSRDRIMLNLRLSEGIDLLSFQQEFGAKKRQQLEIKARPWLDSGHLRRKSNRLFCEIKGWLILDTITRELT